MMNQTESQQHTIAVLCMTIRHGNRIMSEIIFFRIESINAGIIADPYNTITVFKDARDEIATEGMWVVFIALKVYGANSIIPGNAVAGTYPDIAPAVLKEMVYDILRQAILDIKVFEIVIRIEFLCQANTGDQQSGDTD
jgi:hypothetical protein